MNDKAHGTETAEATVWFGVAEPDGTKLGRINPWHRDVSNQDGDVTDDHIEYLCSIGLWVIRFGEFVNRERSGLCLQENKLTLSNRVGPSIVNQKQWKHIPSHEWLELLDKARWVGPKEPRVYLSMLFT